MHPCASLSACYLRAPGLTYFDAPLSLSLCALACLSLAACDASGGADPLGTGGEPFAGSAPLSDAPALALSEPSINPDDSWVTAEVTMSYAGTLRTDAPVRDAVTGQQTTILGLEEPPAQYVLQSGYEADGSLVMEMERLDPAGNPLTELVDTVRDIRLDEGAFSFEGASGEALFGTSPGVGEPAQGALAPGGGPLPTPTFDGMVSETLLEGGEAMLGVARPYDGGTITATHYTQAKRAFTVHESVLPDGTAPGRTASGRTAEGGPTLLEAADDRDGASTTEASG